MANTRLTSLDCRQSKKRSKFQKALSLSQKKVAVVENKKLNKFADQVLVFSHVLSLSLSRSLSFARGAGAGCSAAIYQSLSDARVTAQEAKNSEAVSKKRVEQEEHQKRREELQAQQAVLARKAREADATAAAVRSLPPPISRARSLSVYLSQSISRSLFISSLGTGEARHPLPSLLLALYSRSCLSSEHTSPSSSKKRGT